MKRKALIAMVLLVVVTLLAGCGGVSQEDLDAAVADKDAALAQVTTLRSQLTTAQSDLSAANTAKSTAQTSLTAAQAELTKAKADLATATSSLNASKAEVTTLTAKVADLTKQVADLKAAAAPPVTPPVTPPAGGFTGTTYTNTAYNFTLTYPTAWAAKTDDTATVVLWRFGDSATYFMPSVRVIERPEADGATLKDVFTKVITADGKTMGTFTESTVTINGTAFSKGVVVYAHSTYGNYDSMVIGLKKSGKWVMIEAYNLPGLGGKWSTTTLQSDIINSVKFN